ncbi:MAG: retroviral-like aspartic protease family protein [Candidatus Omnitrophica bacterium]|nr:retroviral-like aspartic protease family protein [Candidatus Omnitrophota bacterium]
MKSAIFLVLMFCSGCAVLEATGEAVGVVGKVGWAATKAVGSAVYTGTSMAGQTANQTNKTLARSSGRRDEGVSVSGNYAVVPLEQEGKSYYVRLKINNNVSGRFLLDTGASAVQISKAMAKRLKVMKSKSQAVPVTLAGGAVVAGRMITLEQIKLGGMTAHNVKAIILDYEQKQTSDGLLGMSFLENFVFQIDTKKSELVLKKR